MRLWLVTLTEHVEECAVILKNVWKLTNDRPLFAIFVNSPVSKQLRTV